MCRETNLVVKIVVDVKLHLADDDTKDVLDV